MLIRVVQCCAVAAPRSASDRVVKCCAVAVLCQRWTLVEGCALPDQIRWWSHCAAGLGGPDGRGTDPGGVSTGLTGGRQTQAESRRA